MVLLRRTGRTYGGIHILVAPPSGGKSYIGTAIANEIFEEGKNRRIYSNFPIRTRDGSHCSYVWERKLMKENLSGQVIMIDEGHKEFWSRDFKNFSKEDKDWWSTTGHNELTVYIFTQELARIDCIITDKATMIWDIEKVTIPILEIVLYFRVTQWPSKEAYQASSKGMLSKPPVAIKYYFFSQKIADMYDTHYFRANFGEPYIGKTWEQKAKEDGKPLKAPYPTRAQIVGMQIDEQKQNIIKKVDVPKRIEQIKRVTCKVQQVKQWRQIIDCIRPYCSMPYWQGLYSTARSWTLKKLESLGKKEDRNS